MMIGISKPRLNTCWFCEKPKAAAAHRNGRAVCAQCDGFMAQGVICIGVTCPLEHDTIIDKIYRDGNWCVLSRDEYERRFRVSVPLHRFAFVETAAWFKAALPRFGKHGASHTDNTAPSLVPEDIDDEVESEA
jgi:hypothetical protein